MLSRNVYINWCIAIILLVVFIHYANIAIQSLKASMEEIAPPTDYLKGDSWEMEQELKKLGSGTPRPPDLHDPNAFTQPYTPSQDPPANSSTPPDPSNQN